VLFVPTVEESPLRAQRFTKLQKESQLILKNYIFQNVLKPEQILSTMAKCDLCGSKRCWHFQNGECNRGDSCRKCHHIDCEECGATLVSDRSDIIHSGIKVSCPDHDSICHPCCSCDHPECTNCLNPTSSPNQCECSRIYCDDCGGCGTDCYYDGFDNSASGNFHMSNQGGN